MKLVLPTQSTVEDLRTETVRRAQESFSFFARAVLGLRRQMSVERCDALEAGAEPRWEFERRALMAWGALGEGTLPPELAWAAPASPSERMNGIAAAA